MSQALHAAAAPVVIIPYVWIGDFVRCHSVVKLLRAQAPERPVDMVSSTLCAPLADYMPGVRRTIIADLPRRRLGIAQQRELAARLRAGGYAQALIMSRKWKAALAPFLTPTQSGKRFLTHKDYRAQRAQHLLPHLSLELFLLA